MQKPKRRQNKNKVEQKAEILNNIIEFPIERTSIRGHFVDVNKTYFVDFKRKILDRIEINDYKSRITRVERDWARIRGEK